MACCIMALLACCGHAQKTQGKGPKWIDWTIEYKGQLSKEEKTRIYSAIDSYVKDYLIAQKREDLTKNLRIRYAESGNTIRVSLDGSEVATGSIVVGPHPPPPPIIPNDKLKGINEKLLSAKNMR